MISGIDHVVIAVRNIAEAVRAYETLLGREARQAEVRDGVASASIALDNIAVELMAPAGDGEAATRLRAALEDGEGLKSLVFAAKDIVRGRRRCERLGLNPHALNSSPTGRSFRADTARTHGVRLFFVERGTPLPVAPPGPASALALDHVVVQSADMERAAALYGARLGLDMRLDRELRGRRLMFFRCGDAVLEVAQVEHLRQDLLWGLSWRVVDAALAHARLTAAGLDVSEVRAGLKPGTRVFTVRDGTCNVPTLMIEAGSVSL